jgi:anti-sigma factor RsiW
VPTLVYRHAKHIISLTAVPASGRGNSAPVLSAVNGYNMDRWVEDRVTYWAVSDVAPADLKKFAELFRTTPLDQ